MYLVWGLLFIVAFYPVPDANGWSFRQGLGMLFMSFVISYLLGKKYHVSVGLCVLMTLVLGILQCGNTQFGSEVVSSIMMILFFSCLALGLKDKHMELVLPI